jgi:DNA primase
VLIQLPETIVKYLAKLSFEIDGAVDKADIIGAIFGQTEGLFGPEMNLNELQKNWKVGRIEILIESQNGKASGSVTIPMSTDISTVSLIAAAVEQIDKVGPCGSKFKLLSIDDVRAVKRNAIVERAKEISRNWASKSSSEGEDMLKDISESTVQKGKVLAFGKDECPAGPAINTSNEIIVVEGRADILNLMRVGIENTIAVEGTSVPQTIVELAKTKSLSAFLDGDRGGDLILRELSSVVKLTKVSRATRGKEVEDLTPVELLECLKSEGSDNTKDGNGYQRRDNYQRREGGYQRRDNYQRREGGYQRRDNYQRREGGYQRRDSDSWNRDEAPVEQKNYSEVEEIPVELVTKAKDILGELEGSLEAHLYDSSMNEVLKVPVNELVKNLEDNSGSEHLIFDGIVTDRLIELADSSGIKSIITNRIGNVKNNKTSLKIITFNQIR